MQMRRGRRKAGATNAMEKTDLGHFCVSKFVDNGAFHGIRDSKTRKMMISARWCVYRWIHGVNAGVSQIPYRTFYYLVLLCSTTTL